ncbi:MAG: LysM peptidoglycan-binding domain-containing protein [Acidimicrobiales bacterium]
MSSSALALRLQPTTVPPGPGRPARPALRVLDGGRAPGRVAQRAAYRRRRLVAALVALALLAATLLLASAAVAGIAGGDPSSAAGESSPTASATVVVQPGDTLWTIAAATQPEVDVRVAVDRLVALNGSGPLVVGQELVLPG